MSKIFGYITPGIRPPFNFRKAVLTVALVVLLVGIPVLSGIAGALAQTADDGEVLFDGSGCSACHSTGTNAIIGPGLAGVAERAATRTSLSADDYIRQSLTDPGAFVVVGFPPVMPAFTDLTDAEINGLIAYLTTLSDGEAAPAAGPESAAPETTAPEPTLLGSLTGNSGTGENLFTGSDRFDEKGPPCSACHSSSGLGALGGGTLGPDLTGAFAKLGEGMILFPETSRTMRPIFTERPLTDQEKADLLAFFRSADASERDTQEVIQLAGLALVGAAIIALFTHLIWRRRLRSVRKTLVGR